MTNTELLAIAETVARAAGELAARRRREGVEVAASKSSPVDIVTLADRETEALIRSMLADARPGDGFFGEESDAGSSSTGLTWIVDPIDGTVNYLYGIPHYAVSIAVVEGDPDPLTWSALAGCVTNPASGETYTATAGGGAYLTRQSGTNQSGTAQSGSAQLGAARAGTTRLRVADAVPLELALIGTGFAYSAETRGEQGAVIARLLPLVRDIRRMGTASLDLCAVASGRLNAYFERTLSPWDHAAGALIAREAGARVSGWDGTPPSADFILAAAPELAAELENVLGVLRN
jgi:myo-inositol-1(or 4)-monophosphatase